MSLTRWKQPNDPHRSTRMKAIVTVVASTIALLLYIAASIMEP